MMWPRRSLASLHIDVYVDVIVSIARSMATGLQSLVVPGGFSARCVDDISSDRCLAAMGSGLSSIYRVEAHRAALTEVS